MKAIRYHEYGASSVLRLEDAPMPEIATDEVLVKVHTAGVNPADWKFRSGWFKDYVALPMPYTGGRDISGTVVKHGPLATRFPPGSKIFAMSDVMRSGAFAEYAVLRGDEIAAAPTTIAFEHAAGVPLAALTAWMALFDNAKLTPGQSILVNAAAGGVGSFMVQFAKLAGAHVIATASASNLELVKSSLGADEVIDYRRVDFKTVVKDLDIAIDPFGGEILGTNDQCAAQGRSASLLDAARSGPGCYRALWCTVEPGNGSAKRSTTCRNSRADRCR